LYVHIGEIHDVFCYANLLYMTGQYHRALHHLRAHHIDKVSILCGFSLCARTVYFVYLPLDQ